MKRFINIVLRVAVILLVPGVVLLTAGGVMGGVKNLRDSVFSLSGRYTDSTLAETRPQPSAPQSVPQPVQPQQPAAGGVQSQIHSLDFEVGAAKLVLQQGEDFALEVTGNPHYRSWQEKGEWKIEMQPEVYLSDIPTFYVTVPQGAEFMEVELSVGAGSVTADSLTCAKSSIEVGAGTVQIDKLVSGQCDMEVGAGYIQVGSGRLAGKTDIECGMGSVELNVERPESYGGSLEVAMGTVTIDGSKFSGIGQEQRFGALAGTVLYEIECAMGTVDISFIN